MVHVTICRTHVVSSSRTHVVVVVSNSSYCEAIRMESRIIIIFVNILAICQINRGCRGGSRSDYDLVKKSKVPYMSRSETEMLLDFKNKNPAVSTGSKNWNVIDYWRYALILQDFEKFGFNTMKVALWKTGLFNPKDTKQSIQCIVNLRAGSCASQLKA